MVGVNQCLMAALSMVIIAAVIGGFNDIGWEVLLTMRKAQFGESLLAGSGHRGLCRCDRPDERNVLAMERKRYDQPRRLGAAGLHLCCLTAVFWALASERVRPDPARSHWPGRWINGLTSFTQNNGPWLDALKNNSMFYVLLPLRIGLDQAVLPFTWGFMPGHLR